MRQYSQPGHPEKKLFLSDEVYSQALQSLIKYCHDVVPIGPDGKFYLPRRKANNHLSGLWTLGGAVIPFMPLMESLIKVIRRETGIEFPVRRFQHIGKNRYWFNGEHGGTPHDAVCEMHTLHLSMEELSQVRLDPKEYEEGSLQPFGLEEILNISDKFVRRIFLDLWNQLMWR